MKKNLLWAALVMASVFVGCSNDEDLLQSEQNYEKGTATIVAGTTQQYIRGFGGANIIGWTTDLTEDQRVKAFSNWSGIGLSILRVRVSPNSADWASNVTTMEKCKYYGGSVIASSWTAPAAMKSSNSLIGGKLNASSYAAYAAHLKAFNTAVGGVLAISPSNEPDWVTDYESMNNTATELGAFIAQQGANCGTAVMGPESLGMVSSYTTSCNSAAGANLKYICGHIYGATPYTINLGKEVWMTEHITDSNDANIWSGAINTAKEIHDCMNAGWSMWVHWYIRRSYGLIDESGNITKRGWVVANFARYIRPGFTKVSCTANPTSGVYVTAYKNGASLVVVAINQNASATYQAFSFSGVSATGFNRYKTTSAVNLEADSFTVSGSSFGINLPASSVTTLVSY
jgi:glucuronoarabinoxylan endo-1,4-beta-xylanase